MQSYQVRKYMHSTGQPKMVPTAQQFYQIGSVGKKYYNGISALHQVHIDW